jgi:hypothetical protein
LDKKSVLPPIPASLAELAIGVNKLTDFFTESNDGARTQIEKYNKDLIFGSSRQNRPEARQLSLIRQSP